MSPSNHCVVCNCGPLVQTTMEDQTTRTCDVYRTDPNLPSRFNNPDCFKGYSEKKSHPLYRTSNQTYGGKKPTVHEMQTQFKGISRKFSEERVKTGMYRDDGFNTSLDRSAVTISTATQRNRLDRQYIHQCLSGNN